jgi:hypothetical protein
MSHDALFLTQEQDRQVLEELRRALDRGVERRDSPFGLFEWSRKRVVTFGNVQNEASGNSGETAPRRLVETTLVCDVRSRSRFSSPIQSRVGPFARRSVALTSKRRSFGRLSWRSKTLIVKRRASATSAAFSRSALLS